MPANYLDVKTMQYKRTTSFHQVLVSHFNEYFITWAAHTFEKKRSRHFNSVHLILISTQKYLPPLIKWKIHYNTLLLGDNLKYHAIKIFFKDKNFSTFWFFGNICDFTFFSERAVMLCRWLIDCIPFNVPS